MLDILYKIAMSRIHDPITRIKAADAYLRHTR